VIAVTHDWIPRPEPVERLASAGAISIVQDRSQPFGLWDRVVRKVARTLSPKVSGQSGIWQSVLERRPGFVCVNQGSAYDAPFSSGLAPLLLESHSTFGVICQHNFEHFVLDDDHKARIAAYYSAARWVAFVAEGNRRKTERELGVRVKNAVLVKNPVNLVDRSKVSWPGGPARFACVARLEAAYKGQDLLFEVLAGERWRDRDWRLRFYGAGEDRHYLERVHAMFGSDKRIEFAGHVADVRQIWADNHVLVLPSRSEGTPLSLVEAMLCGRPVLATDVGGNSEWIVDGETGFIAEAPSVHSMAATLERAWEMRERWPAMGERAHEAAGARVDPTPGGSLVDLIERSLREQQ
jgi:glycosyltransferase involved in cell wall biosynthesis